MKSKFAMPAPLVRADNLKPILMVFIVFFCSLAEASHFRYGLITATRLSETATQVTYRLNVTLAWRLGQAPSNTGFSISGGNSSSVNVTLTNVTDPSGQWTNSTGTANVTLNKTATPTRIEFTSCCKLSTTINNTDGSWDVYLILNTNGPGSTPVSTLPAIINMPVNAPAATYSIPATDPDAGSTLTFGLPNLASGPLAGQTEPTGFSVDAAGLITFNTIGKSVGQLYNAFVTVTDNNGNQIFLDFLINMVGASNPPVFDYTVTPTDGFVYNVIAGQNITFPIKAADSDAGSTVSLSVSGLPAYITTANFSSNPLPATGNPSQTTFSWTPAGAQIGSTVVLNFIATDNVGVQASTSVTIRVVAEPAPVFISPTPGEATIRQIIPGVLHQDNIVSQSSLGSNVSIAFATIPSGSVTSPSVPTTGANPAQTTLSWTPAVADWGQHTLSFQATIAAIPTIFSTRTYDIIVNTPPFFTSVPGTLSVQVGSAFSYNVTISDPDIPYGDIVNVIGSTLPSWLTLTSTGNGTALLQGTPSPSDVGLNAVELEAEDIYHHGNPAAVAQSFSINVLPCDPPVITCPANVTANATSGQCSTFVSVPQPTVTYDCQAGGISNSFNGQNDASGTYPVGATTVIFTATDASGSTATCSMTVTVSNPTVEICDNGIDDNCNGITDEDVTPPVLTCPGDITVVAATSACGAVVTYANPSATDNCAIVVAGSQTFNYTGSIVNWTVPVGVTEITIDAFGAQGGGTYGGLGAEVQGKFIVTHGQVLKILVGEAGKSSGVMTSGGGGSFVTTIGNVPLLVAGGGGGASASGSNQHGTTTTSGQLAYGGWPSTGFSSFSPGINGNGGQGSGGFGGGGGGGGLYSDGYADESSGRSFVSGGLGGSGHLAGGFGGGGGSRNNGNSYWGGGAGGGYSGGVGACGTPSFPERAGGGGSFNGGINQSGTSGIRTGNGQVMISWNVNTTPTPVQTTGISSGSIFPIGTTSNTFTATDAAGNTSTCSFDVTVVDNEAPSISCPASFTVTGTPGAAPCTAPVIYATPVGADNCAGAITALTGGLASGSLFPEGSTLITYTVTDAAGLTSSCSFTVTVGSCNQPPSAVCQNVTVSADGNCEAAVAAGAVGGGSSDPDGNPITLSLSPAGPYPLGSTNVTLTVSDGQLSSACNATITVADNTAPSVTCPANITTGSDAGVCGAAVTFSVSFGDNCSGATLAQTAGLSSGATFPVGTTTNSFVATDASGNTAVCSFDVTVNDTENPSISCPANITTGSDAGVCGAAVTFSGSFGDNCPGATLAQTAGLSSGATFPVGTTTNSFVATDASGNTTACSFDVTVNDTENPSISCPANITTGSDAGICGAAVTFSVSFGDNCSGVTVAQTAGLSSGATFPVGTTTNSFVATDASGNTASCSFDVTVNDTENPTVSCPNNVSTVNEATVCGAVINYSVGFNDNCPGATLAQTAGFSSGATFPAGVTINTFTVTAANGATASCSFTVTVNASCEPGSPCVPQAIITPAPSVAVCQGEPLMLSANAGADLIYQWYNYGTLLTGETSQTLTFNSLTFPVDTPISYRVRVTHAAAGCFTNSDFTNITVHPLPDAGFTPAGNLSLCSGSTQLLSGVPVATTTYQWAFNGSPIGGNTGNLMAYQAGTYSLSVTNSYGCTATSPSSATITFTGSAADLVANAGPDQIKCENSATLAGNAPPPGVTGTWTCISGMATITNVNSPTTTVTGLSAGQNKFSWRMSDGTCMGTADEVIVNYLSGSSPVVITAGGPINYCNPGSVTFTANVCGTGWTFQWQQNGLNMSGKTAQTLVVTNTAAVSYRVRATKNGIRYNSNSISINPIPSITINGPTSICPPNVTTLLSLSNAGVAYQWYKNNISISGATGATYIVSSAGSYTCRIYYNATCYQTTPAKSIAAVSNCSSKKEDALFAATTGTDMLAAYPNPFSESLNIEFSLAQDTRAKLEIFTITGVRLATLFEGDAKGGELRKFSFTADKFSEGVFIYRLQTEQESYLGKAVMVK